MGFRLPESSNRSLHLGFSGDQAVISQCRVGPSCLSAGLGQGLGFVVHSSLAPAVWARPAPVTIPNSPEFCQLPGLDLCGAFLVLAFQQGFCLSSTAYGSLFQLVIPGVQLPSRSQGGTPLQLIPSSALFRMGSVPILDFRHYVFGKEGARNRCIGRSGASALPRRNSSKPLCRGSRAPLSSTCLPRALWTAGLHVFLWLVALSRTLLAVQGLALMKLLCMAMKGKRTAPGRFSNALLHRALDPIPTPPVLSLCCACPHKPVMVWEPAVKSRHRRDNHIVCRRCSSSLGSRLCRLSYVLVALFGFSRLPCQVHAMDTLRQATFNLDLAYDERPPFSNSDLATARQRCKGKFTYISGPPLGERPARPAVDTEPTLGVTVYAPHFIPTFFGLRIPAGASLDDVTDEVFRACWHPGRGLDKIIPVKRQRHSSALSLLALPSFLGACSPACCVVILDLSCVGGHYHAAIVHSSLTRHDLRTQIQPLIWHDGEDVEIWVDDAEFAASHGTLAFSDGSVFTVLLPGNGPPLTYPAENILRADAEWGPFEHTPRPYRMIGDAVVSPYEVFCLRWHLLSPLSLEGCVRRSLHLAEDSCIQHTFRHMQLDVHGDYCRSVYVEAERGTPWLIDARAAGAPLRVHVGDCAPDPTQVRALLPFVLPPDYDIVLTLEKRHCDADYLRVVFVDVVVADVDAVCVPSVSLARSIVENKGPSEGTPALSQAVASMEAQGLTGFLPQPLRRLGPILPREDHDPEAEPGDSDADSHDTVCKPTFCVISPDVVPEIVQLALDFPCTVDNALRELADAIDAARYRFFPRLIEVRPQPSQFWALAVALPPWTRMEPIVVFNLTRLDGRCFAASLVSPFRRCHVLAAVGFAEDSDVDVFAFMRFRPLDPEQECDVIEGGAITIRRRGSAHTIQGHSLDVMLRTSIGWDPEPDLPQPSNDRRICVVQEAAFGFVTADNNDDSDEVCLLRILGLRAEHLHFAFGTPELPDVMCKGLPCGTVFAYIAADAGTLALPNPPRVVILDCRPILQGLTLWVTPTGLIPYWELTNWAEVFCPPGWQAQLLGAPIEEGHLQVESGCVLTVEFVPVTSPDVRPEDEQAGSSHGDSDSDHGFSMLVSSSGSEPDAPATANGAGPRDVMHAMSARLYMVARSNPMLVWPLAALRVCVPGSLLC